MGINKILSFLELKISFIGNRISNKLILTNNRVFKAQTSSINFYAKF